MTEAKINALNNEEAERDAEIKWLRTELRDSNEEGDTLRQKLGEAEKVIENTKARLNFYKNATKLCEERAIKAEEELQKQTLCETQIKNLVLDNKKLEAKRIAIAKSLLRVKLKLNALENEKISTSYMLQNRGLRRKVEKQRKELKQFYQTKKVTTVVLKKLIKIVKQLETK